MATKILDGIISFETPDYFHSQSRKILFVLKEAVRRDKRKENDEYRLLKYLYKGADSKSPTWNNTGIWSYLLRHYGDPDADTSWKRAKRVTDNKSIELRKIAVVNINKDGGESSTNDSLLYENFERDAECRELLLRQIEEDIKPDIVLCGGKVVRKCMKLLYPESKWLMKSLSNGINASYSKIGERIFIQYYHPQYFGFTQEQLYSSLEELLDFIFKEK